MNKIKLFFSGISLLPPLFGFACLSAQSAHRPPAVPLVANDPYFSIWSMSDRLTDGPTKHWSETPQPMTGLIRIDGKTMRWMGVRPRQYFAMPELDAMKQESLTVTPLHTRYVFSAAGIRLHVTFFTPLFPKDLDVMSRPVTYLSWSAESTDSKTHKVDLLLDVGPEIAINDTQQPVTWGRTRVKDLTLLNVGSRDQAILHQSGDRIRIDWGYFHLGVPANVASSTALAWSSMATFATQGVLPDSDDQTMPKPADWRVHPVHLAVQLPLGDVGSSPVERHVLLAYTDNGSIEYLGRRLRGYWQRNGMSEAEMLQRAEQEYPSLEERGVQLDKEIIAEATQSGGEDYAYLISLAFRQTIAAHKLVADVDGQPMFFSKENDSNGCIDTVDVTYPSSPFFLFFNPQLLHAQLEPMLRYAALPRWRFPFAPHDLGTFPLANGQVYGGGEETEDNQMPVEESGNLLILVAALGRAEHNWDFARHYMPQLKTWAEYLEKNGLDPANQLSTDDFSGHLARNSNLSIKAIEALGAFAEIADATGDASAAKHFRETAKGMAAQWQTMARSGNHYTLAFGAQDTWSQKYNLAWDEVLGLHLFPRSVIDDEWKLYATQMKPYGLPLDNRKTITKLDWQLWTATLTKDPAQFHDLVHRLVLWSDQSTSRVPLTDYYDTVSGQQIHFQARSVVGGLTMKMLSDAGTLRAH
ncbi:glutaminase domain-containing protein [Silvibacterium acidisoli]|uniref:glutaminase domain-containing protein n=1 Tax=Acidobacteriaceae bacterium ZG23-2 TaxID=2883246 RepID=UPI00406CF46A